MCARGAGEVGEIGDWRGHSVNGRSWPKSRYSDAAGLLTIVQFRPLELPSKA